MKAMRIKRSRKIIISSLLSLAVIIILFISLNHSGKSNTFPDKNASAQKGIATTDAAASTGKGKESLFGSATTTASHSDNTTMELGQVFQSNVPGTISDIRCMRLRRSLETIRHAYGGIRIIQL